MYVIVEVPQAEVLGATLAEIVGSVQRVADLMNDIAAASNEQSQGIGRCLPLRSKRAMNRKKKADPGLRQACSASA